MNSKEEICLYCLERFANSDDHIFPQFLGGQATVRSCTSCNSKFGHDFEAVVSEQIAPLAVLLALGGVRIVQRMTWKHFYKDQSSGVEYDLDTNLKATPSKPRIEFDENGKFRRGIFPAATALKEARRLGKRIKVTKVEENISLSKLAEKSFNLSIGTDLRRLALKMCLALATRSDRKILLDERTRSYLLGREFDAVPVRIAYDSFVKLDALRPPLAHLIYVEGDTTYQRLYGLIQLFGTIQMYVVMNADYTGREFSTLGILDPITGTESFSEVGPLSLPEAPVTTVPNPSLWADRLQSQLRSAVGDKGLTIQIAQGISSQGLVADILKGIDPKAILKENDKITGKLTGKERQIDISLREAVTGGDQILIVIVTRYLDKKPNLGMINDIYDVMLDVNATKGILVCRGKPSASIKNEAHKRNIEICTLYDMKTRPWKDDFKIPVIFVRYNYEIGFSAQFTIPDSLMSFLPTRVELLRFTLDRNSTFDIGDKFVELCKTAHIKKDHGKTYEVRLDNIELSLGKSWLPVTNAVLTYKTTKTAKMKFVEPSEYRMLKDHVSGKQSEKFAMQFSHTTFDDPSWSDVQDPDEVERYYPGLHLIITENESPERESLQISGELKPE